jgi:ABC-2 type transport system ATP-binding protein
MSTILDQPHSMTLAVSLREVSKTYRHFRLDSIDLEIEPGTVNGLVGPNGAGKSTIMRIIMGLVAPHVGRVCVLGQPISSREASAKNDIGYFADDMRLYKSESIAFHMHFVRSVYPSWEDKYARKLLDRFGLIAGQKVKGLSHGQRVKCLLMLILARRPKLLILDEPTNGLDPVAKQEVLSELMQVVNDETRTILYSSHNTQDIETICDTITFIDRGRVIASNNRDQFLESWRRFKLQVPHDWQAPEIDGFRTETNFGNLRVMTTDRYQTNLEDQLQASGAIIEASDAMTLEEIFIANVNRGREENHK